MKLLSKIFNFYIFSNIHVSFAAFSFTKLTLLYYGVNANLIPIFMMASTFLAYNFLRIYDLGNNLDMELKSWISNNLLYLLVLSGFAFLIVFYLLTLLNSVLFWWVLPLVILTILYIIPVVKIKNKSKSLRMFPYLKMIYVVLIWTVATSIIPLISLTSTKFDFVVFSYILSRFLLLFALIIPFEIRDLGYDSVNLKTLPQVIGINNSKFLGLILLAFSGFLNSFLYLNSVEFYISIIILAITAVLLLKGTKKQSKYYSAFWVEGIPILWLILVKIYPLFIN